MQFINGVLWTWHPREAKEARRTQMQIRIGRRSGHQPPDERLRIGRWSHASGVLVRMRRIALQLHNRHRSLRDAGAHGLSVLILIFALAVWCIDASPSRWPLLDGSPQSASRPSWESAARSQTVILAYINQRWNPNDPWTRGRGVTGSWPGIPDAFFLKGKKPSVDVSMSPLLTDKSRDNPREELGRGQAAYQSWPDFDCAALYRDKTGVRLYLHFSPQFDGALQDVIVSKISRHRARLVRQDLAGLRVPPGLRLGDTRGRVEHALGQPSERDRFGQYDIAFYLQRPVPLPDSPGKVYANAEAFVYRAGKIVEIWIRYWSTGKMGG